MRPTLISCRRRLRHSLAGLVIAMLTMHGPVETVLLTYAAVAVLAAPQMAAAQSQTRSSGGYTRPGGAYRRTPSFGDSASERRPSVSGGYGRPTASMSSRSGSAWSLPKSASDQALARQSSREALEAFRQRSQPEGSSRRPSIGSPGPWDGPRRRDPVWETRAAREDWYGRSGWSPPSSAGRTLPQFGMWDAMFVWYLLNTLSQPGHADFFHHHAADPSYTAWRAEADRLAAADPSVRQKLADLDARLTAMQEKPRAKDYLPPDTPPTIALAADQEADDSGWGLGFILLLVLVGVVVLFAWRLLGAGRRAREAGGASSQPSGTSYRPDWFRVGMTFPVDPAPFILAANMTHVRAPEGATDSGLISVEAVGEVTTDGVHWHRLYLPGGQCFFQVHLDAEGRPDECRYFSWLDEVVPASPEEWAFWLDAAEGAIGWPEFQTKDNKVYTRVWAQGDTRVAPRVLTETLTNATNPASREWQAMLYAAPTGAEPPAPATEYILVAAADQGGQAWVDVYAGIDVPVGMLQLS
jgi:hypothetical protein